MARFCLVGVCALIMQSCSCVCATRVLPANICTLCCTPSCPPGTRTVPWCHRRAHHGPGLGPGASSHAVTGAAGTSLQSYPPPPLPSSSPSFPSPSFPFLLLFFFVFFFFVFFSSSPPSPPYSPSSSSYSFFYPQHHYCNLHIIFSQYIFVNK